MKTLGLVLMAGVLLGACDSDDARPSIEVTGQSRTESDLTLTLRTDAKLYNIWATSCRYGRPPRLQRLQDGVWAALRDDRPVVSIRPPYYLDGILQTDCSLGCDGGDSCYEAGPQFTLTTLEYQQVGTRQPADSEAVCGRHPTTALPDIVSRPTQGPYRFELSYLAKGCQDFDHETTVLIAVPEPK